MKGRVMKRIEMKQGTYGDCGICVAAMATNYTYDKIFSTMKNHIWDKVWDKYLIMITQMKLLLNYLNTEWYYLKFTNWASIKGDICILVVDKKGAYYHYVIYIPSTKQIIDPRPDKLEPKPEDYEVYSRYFSIIEIKS
jgi:hypothetical protein